MAKARKENEEKKLLGLRYLTEEQAAEYLCCSPNTLRYWRNMGRINNKGDLPPKHYIKGKHVYYEEHELAAWVQEGARQ